METTPFRRVIIEVNRMDQYLSGEKLYGNDFSQEQIDAWFADEAEGYFELANTGREYVYGYAALNEWYGYSKLPRQRFGHVVGIGAAYGDELRPVLSVCNQVTILEPSEGFVSTELQGVPVRYVKPAPSGTMPFDDSSVDLITCFGVLHHIPNVSKVISEIARVLTNGGYALLREPTISMGDWRMPRRGLTKHERGIPARILREAIASAGLTIVSERRCVFSLTSRLRFLVRGSVYNSRPIVALDALLSWLPFWSTVYHPTTVVQKLRPTSVYYVLRKA